MSIPTYGTVFADDRVESHYDSLASALTHIAPGHIVPPYSRPIDTIAPEELETPDPTIFPDDLAYLSTTHDEAHLIYLEDLKTHVPPSILTACPNILDLLTSDLALSVFVPKQLDGIKMEPYHLDIKRGLPAFMRARARPVRDASLKDAKAEFDRMLQYFFIRSNSPIASPIVVAPKATSPFIRLCGDYRQVNPYISISQEPIPHVQYIWPKLLTSSSSST